jgi:hypothetical protein
MKVVLTAFQGILSSEAREWREQQGLQVTLQIDDMIGIFVSSGRYRVLDGGETAEEYTMVEVIRK